MKISKNYILYIILSCSLFAASYANAQGWQWAKRFGANGYGNTVTTDVLGNVYVTGTNSRPIVTFGSYILTNANIYIVKYDAFGNVLWAKGATGSGFSTSVKTDAMGNVYITGAFQKPTLSFGSITLINPNSITSAEYIFLAKYDNMGNLIWAKSVGTVDGGINIPYAMAVDASNNVYIAGEMGSTSLVFGSIALSNIGSSGFNVFFAKYSASGNIVWAKNYGGAGGGTEATAMYADAFGHIYLAGVFQCSTITFGSTILTHTTTSGQPYNGFLVKYDTVGNVIWANSVPGGNWGNTWAVATDGHGNVYLAGHFTTPITIGTTVLTGAGQADINLVKYDSSGAVIWVKKAGGSNVDEVKGLVCDVFGNIYLCGQYNSPSISFGSISIANTGNGDGFLTVYDNFGNVMNVIDVGGNDFDQVHSMASDPSCKIYVTGSFKSSGITMGGSTLLNDTTGTANMFLAKWVCEKVEVDNLIDNEILFYPNPANEEIHIEHIIPNTAYKLYNVVGAVVQEGILPQANNTIALRSLPPGMYLLQLTDEQGGRVVRKVVKE